MNLIENQSRDKNKLEYNSTANQYEQWASSDPVMQHMSYYSTITEIEKELFDIQQEISIK